jgi:hypothetical protein
MNLHARRTLISWPLMAFGGVLTYITYFPGLMSTDSVDQLRQAQTGTFVDWHPPIMAWLWSITNHFIPGPQGFFLFLITLYWLGFGLLLVYFSRLTLPRYLIALLLPFSPIFVNFVGTIWKDVLVFGCFLTALGLILLWRPHYKLNYLIGVFICLLLLTGTLARYNSVLAAIPLLVLWIWPEPAASRPLISAGGRLAVCTVIVSVIWAASGKLLDHFVFHSEKTSIQNSLFMWDLVGISQRIGQNLVPGNWSEAQSKEIVYDCAYNHMSIDTVMFNECSFVSDALHQSGQWQAGLFPAWARAVVEHPEAYLYVRLAYAHTLFWPTVMFMFGSRPEAYQFGFHENSLFIILKDIFYYCKYTPVIHLIFTVMFWMLTSAIFTILSLRCLWRGRSEYYRNFLLFLSAAVYVWPLLVVGTGGDFRFAYWCVAATCISVLLWPPRAPVAQSAPRGGVTNRLPGLSTQSLPRYIARPAGSHDWRE